jgi:hypothetical protein
MDESGLANCVVFSCQRPAVKDMAYCTAHLSLIPEASPPAPVDDTPLPDPAPVPSQPDMRAMEPVWEEGQWVLKPKSADHPDVRLKEYRETLDNVRSLVRELMAEVGILAGDYED